MKNKELLPIILPVLVIFLGFVFFYSQIKSTSSLFISTYGLIAIFLVVIVMDTVIQPISPDILVFGATLGGADLLAVSLIGGLGSCVAGVFGYHLGKNLGSDKFEKKFGKKHLDKGQALFNKYGIYAVIVGAFSPIPYSSVCWVAGIYGMSIKPFIITSVFTRVPRFFLMGLLGAVIYA